LKRNIIVIERQVKEKIESEKRGLKKMLVDSMALGGTLYREIPQKGVPHEQLLETLR
jgi:hypothetical protein